MNIIANFISPFLNFFKKLISLAEFKKYKDAIRRNPHDHQLRARFTKYCLNSYFQGSPSRNYLIEAVNHFEYIVHSDVLDLEVFYLMGKYYQGQDNNKAVEIYLKGINRYNEAVTKSLQFRHDYVEMAFMIAINLLALEANHPDPELGKFFKNVRRTYLKNFLEHKVEFKTEALDNAMGDTK